jgi:hypothetical protein
LGGDPDEEAGARIRQQFRDSIGSVTHTWVMADPIDEKDLVYRLRKRAEIRRQISTRKSVREGQPDRIADLLEEAAAAIEQLREQK